MSITSLILLFFILFIVITFLKSPYFKGILGEKSILLLLNKTLDKSKYIILEDVTLEKNSDTTQIDLIVLSVYGIFVIEVKNYKGWIFGNKNQRQWTQIIYKEKHKFQNPIHQNHKHIKFIEELLKINDKKILKNLVVFVGDSQFKTELPKNVCRPKSLISYISTFNTPLISKFELNKYVRDIERLKLDRSRETNKRHLNNLKTR